MTYDQLLPLKIFGRTGLRVSALCLGTMTFGEEWGWGADRKTSRQIFDRFAERGGNFIDTANNYTNGTSESLVGEFIASDREHFVLGTKYSLSTKRENPNAGGNRRKSLVQSLEASLRRLRTDYIDVYWLHVWDFLTPMARSFGMTVTPWSPLSNGLLTGKYNDDSTALGRMSPNSRSRIAPADGALRSQIPWYPQHRRSGAHRHRSHSHGYATNQDRSSP